VARRPKVLFTFLRSLFSNDLLVELSQNKISIKVFSSDLKYDYEPYIAIEKTKKGEIVKSIGKMAKREANSNVAVTNPFEHSTWCVRNS
jgi:rod shape-determining protein MreB and related proteins